MISFDLHTHSSYSFDVDNYFSIEDMCYAAIKKGITHLALTDHYDINAVEESIYPSPDFYKLITETELAKAKFKGSLVISRGIELGSAIQYPEKALKFLEKYKFETVIASVHYMRGHNDFYFWDMSDTNREEFENVWIKYLTDIEDTVDLGHSDVLAHLTYPLRYYVKAGKHFNIEFSGNIIERIIKKIISKDILLEVNSSGFRQGMEAPLPDSYILGIYRDCGGRLISVGSDAHSPEQIGASYTECEDYIKKCGFNEIHFVMNRNIISQKI